MSKVVWIKLQAKRIKKEKNIPHYEALELAAKAAGFSNWKHFLNASKERVLK